MKTFFSKIFVYFLSFLFTLSLLGGNVEKVYADAPWLTISEVCVNPNLFLPNKALFYRSDSESSSDAMKKNNLFDADLKMKATVDGETIDSTKVSTIITNMFKLIVLIYENSSNLRTPITPPLTTEQINTIKINLNSVITSPQTYSQGASDILKAYQTNRKIPADSVLGVQTSLQLGLDISDICSGMTKLYIKNENGECIQYLGKTSTEGEDLYQDDGCKNLDSQKRKGTLDNGNNLYMIPDNPGVIKWETIGGGKKGESVARGLAWKILNFLLGFVAVIAIAMICYGGFRYITSGGEDVEVPKKILMYSALGLGIVILAEPLFSIIFPTQGNIREDATILDKSKAFNTEGQGSDLIISILNWGLGFVGAIAVAMLIYGGFLMITAGGETEQQGKGKTLIIQAVIGIVIILCAFALVNIFIGGLSSIGK